MIEIKGQDANELYIKASKEIWKNGIRRETRGFETIEAAEEICLVMEDPTESIITVSPRHLDKRVYFYLEGEFNWFKTGDLSIEPIMPYAKFWENIANPDRTINSNYGFYTFIQKTPDGKTQFEWCVESLKKDTGSRQAIININQPMHKYAGNKDFCCTIGQQFIFRNGKLDCMVWMRSNDLVLGTTYNWAWFTYIHRLVAEKTGLPLGRYVHTASSLHVYKRHYEMLEELAKHDLTYGDAKKARKIWNIWDDFAFDKQKSFWQEACHLHFGKDMLDTTALNTVG